MNMAILAPILGGLAMGGAKLGSMAAGLSPQAWAMILGGAAKGTAWGANKIQNWGVDPNVLRQREMMRQQGVTPQQYQTSVQQLKEAQGVLTQPQSIFQPNQAQSRFMPTATRGFPQQINAQTRQAPLGGLAQRLQGVERGQMGGFQDDLAGIGSYMRSANPLGVRMSGTQGMQQEAYNNRMRQTASDQLGLVTSFANQNALNQLQGNELGTLRSSIENKLKQRLGGLQGREQQLGQADFLSQMGYNRGQAGLYNTAESQHRRGANRQYQFGMIPAYEMSALPRRGGM